MIKNEQASLSVIRIAIITIITIFLLSVCVLASSVDVKNVKIILADNCEIDVLTTKTLVSDILEENHVVILPEEKVVPNLDSRIEDNYSKIVVTGITQDASSVASIAEEEKSIFIDQLLGLYSTITEKIVTLEEQVPFETETQNSSKAGETTTKVIKEGKQGLKRAVYKVKYQNGAEIARTLLSEEILEEPVNKIVQVINVTNRSGTSNTRKVAEKVPVPSSTEFANKVQGKEPIVKTLNASAYTASRRRKKYKFSWIWKNSKWSNGNSMVYSRCRKIISNRNNCIHTIFCKQS